MVNSWCRWRCVTPCCLLVSSVVERGPQPIVGFTNLDRDFHHSTQRRDKPTFTRSAPVSSCNATHKGLLNILTASPVSDSEAAHFCELWTAFRPHPVSAR